ncbi:XRE family transcriptional regulator [Paenibacillus sp. BIHB 4019]|uniref:XRE family transcriptional regulator n=1 Tax=Paenibacillus sp. BIHB 4019 TaxID=1870819 RepID=UPI001F336860|nr:XRE family transcriptional regulator [Paenibacillus sp. BIHB 4019]
MNLLKERVEFLCKKRSLARKDLVEGLVTQAHFANILAERYPFADDLAELIATRLAVSPEYLTQAGLQDDATLERAEEIFARLSQPVSTLTEADVNELDDKNDALTIELTTALMKAVYYQQMNDRDAYEYIHRTYLHYYLEKFGREDDPELPVPLKKALFLYKIQHYRSKNQYFEALNNSKRLSALVEKGSEIWLTVQNFLMEASVYSKQYEPAKAIYEQTMQYVYSERLYHRLSGQHLAYSGYCFAMGRYEEALLALSMAEAHLVYTPSPGDLFPSIMNNRIIMLTLLGELDKASDEIARFEELAQQETDETKQLLEPLLLIYRCEVAFASKNWGLLSQGLRLLASYPLTEDQQMTAVFYESQLALSSDKKEAFMEAALSCLPYFEQTQQTMRLEPLYETLAIASEDSRRYKESALYYRKLVYLLRNK